MKKKIKIFCFFSRGMRNPGIAYLFYFSKRRFRLNKQQIKYKKIRRARIKRRKFKEFVMLCSLYKRYIRRYYVRNQWNLNRQKIKIFFLSTFFFNLFTTLKLRKWKRNKKYNYCVRPHHQLIAWFIFFNKFIKKTKRIIRKYPRIGTLSSNIVHVVSRKNITYQTRSKFRSKTFNMKHNTLWLYERSMALNVYTSLLLFSLYSFASNPKTRNIYRDKDFNITTSPVISNTLYNRTISNKIIYKNRYLKFDSPIYIYFNNKQLLDLVINNAEVENYISTLDLSQKKQIFDILKINSVEDEILILSRFFVFANEAQSTFYCDYLLKNIALYRYI